MEELLKLLKFGKDIGGKVGKEAFENEEAGELVGVLVSGVVVLGLYVFVKKHRKF